MAEDTVTKDVEAQTLEQGGVGSEAKQEETSSTETQDEKPTTEADTTETDSGEAEEDTAEGEGGEESGEDKKEGEESSAKEALRLLEENKKLKPFANLGYIAAKLAQTNPEVQKALEAVTTAANEGKDIDEAIANLGKKMEDATQEEQGTDGTDVPAKLEPAIEREIKYAATKVAESYPQIMTMDDRAKAVGKRAFEIYTNDGLPMLEAWNRSAKEIYGAPLSVDESKFKQDIASGVGGGNSSAGAGPDKKQLAAINVNKANGKISIEEAKKLFDAGVLEMGDYLE